MNEGSNPAENKTKATSTLLCPYLVALIGAVVCFAANFIKYLTTTSLFFTRKVSIFQLITESFEYPEVKLRSGGDKAAFAFIIAGIVFAFIALVLVLFKKMKGAIVFSILALLPVLIRGDAWIHYLGAALAIIGAVWYIIAKKKAPASE